VPYLLKARAEESEKQTLLANGSETIIVSRQRLSKHVPTAMDAHTTIEVLLETVFSTRSVQRDYKEDNWDNRVSSAREAVKERFSWKGAAVRKGIEPGSRGIAVVRSRHQATTIEDTAVWKNLARVLVKCKVWRSEMAL
jgi:hypothetical protein